MNRYKFAELFGMPLGQKHNPGQQDGDSEHRNDGMPKNQVILGRDGETEHIITFTTPDDEVVSSGFTSYFSTIQFVATRFVLLKVLGDGQLQEIASTGDNLAPYHHGISFHIGDPDAPASPSGGTGMWEGVEVGGMPELGLEKNTSYELHVHIAAGGTMKLATVCSGPLDGEYTPPSTEETVNDALAQLGAVSGSMELEGQRYRLLLVPEAG